MRLSIRPSARLASRSGALLFIALSLLAPVRADTVLLNDGTELEGKILEETDAYVKIEVQVTKSIKDAKIIQRADIRQLTKETPDSELYAEMQALLPTRDRMGVSDYEELLANFPRRFATQFPSSALLPKVLEIEKKLDAEKALVASGSVKLDGKWVTPAEIAADPYNHEANLLAADLKLLLAGGDLTEALQKFDLLESGFAHAKATATAYDPVRKVLDTYEASLKRSLADNPVKLAEREHQLASLDGEGRQAAQSAFHRELQTFQKEWEAGRAAKQKWLPVNVWDKKSLDEAIKVVTSEKTRLAKVDSAAKGRTAALLALAFSTFAEGKLEAAELQIEKAAEAGVDVKTLAPLRTRVAAAKAAAAATAAAATTEPASPAATDTPPAPTTTPSPPVSPEPPTVPAVSPAKTEPSGTVEPAASAPDKPATTDNTMKGTARDLTGLLDEEEANGDSDEGKAKSPAISFRTIVFILIGAMVLITILAKVFSKPAPEDFEEAADEESDEEEDLRQ